MAPEWIAGNMWRVKEGETVSGEGGEIQGPAVVRVHRFEEMDRVLVQWGKYKIEADAGVFDEKKETGVE